MNQSSSAATGAAALRLQVGGTLVPGRDIYIARPEDGQLLELLGACEYVNILSSRQVGKSSLMLRTALQLRERGYRFALVDLTSLGTPENARAYFRGLVGELARQLKLGFDAEAFWREDASSGTNTQQFIRFFREVVASGIEGPALIFLDEIDSTLKLPYTDDLFTALRSMYNERAIVPAYQRIAFCLVGVATPDELIKDRRTTPYNVGRTLWLGDFDAARDDLTPLVEVRTDDSRRASELLGRVLYWTGGHPFLTARLCQDLRTDGATSGEDVDRFVAARYATLEGLGEDVHIQQILRFVRERLSDGLASFDLYERILKGEKERDQPSLAHAELKLSGLVRRDGNGMLVPRNRIYQQLFDLEWVRKSRPKQEVRRYRRFAYAATALLVLGLIAFVIYNQTYVASLQAQEAARNALDDLRVTLFNGPRGWTEVGLPRQDTQAALQKALPHLATLGKVRDAPGFSLDLSKASAVDLNALASLPGLRRLKLMGTKGTDLSPLARLTGLQELDVSDVPEVDLNALTPLAGLRRLDLMGAKLTNLGPLARLTGLQELDIATNPVTDLAPLANLANLRQLNAAMTLVSDLAPVSRLASLEDLDVSGTRVTDLSPLARLTSLQRLDVSNTQVRDVAPLSGLTYLRELNISRTEVKDLSPLDGLSNLRTLALDGLGITDFNADGRIPRLKILQDPAPRKAGAAYRPGETFRDCSQCPQMVVVPAGRFVMGSAASEAGRFDDEGPQHTVKIAQPFAVGKYEARFDEWMLCVEDGACKAPSEEGWGRGPRPAINVSWDDAKRYVAWLAKQSGQPYRLLTEAEWEYAARAKTTTTRYWDDGEKDACTYASVYDEQGKKTYKFGSESFACDDGYSATAPVGAFQPNAFGLHDMLGNVWEWTEDCYHDSYQAAPSDGSAWVTGDCGSRVNRGGGWGSDRRLVRSAVRDGFTPNYHDYIYLGFRVARTLTP